MEQAEYTRYGRQMIVPEVGLPGQLAIKQAKVLIVGAGGLGCPAIAYLAGAGIGTLGIADGDKVEISNLHRQILHSVPGIPKVESAANFVAELNPNVVVHKYNFRLTADNISDIVRGYDLVLDCTDAPAIRYLINDCCVLLNKPLISAAALRSEGQLAVYHADPAYPCYRCLFPVPPPPELVGSCGDSGVLGPVVGLMGIYQAAEALRLLVSPLSNAEPAPSTKPPSLSLFSLFGFPQWKQVRVRGKRADCIVCGDSPSIKSLADFDYVEFCGSINLPLDTPRISTADFQQKLNSNSVILDVRPRVQFGIGAIPNSVNIPITDLRKMKSTDELPPEFRNEALVVCRFGNDSREAVSKLLKWGVKAYDLSGGLNAWRELDPTFPDY